MRNNEHIIFFFFSTTMTITLWLRWKSHPEANLNGTSDCLKPITMKKNQMFAIQNIWRSTGRTHLFLSMVTRCAKSPKFFTKLRKLQNCLMFSSVHSIVHVLQNRTIFSLGNIKKPPNKKCNCNVEQSLQLPAILWLFKEQILSNDHEV